MTDVTAVQHKGRINIRMDPQTAYYIVSSCRSRSLSSSRQVSPYFDTLHHAVRALKFMRERLPKSENLHIEQGATPARHDA